MIKNLKMEQEMSVANREMLQLNPWSIIPERIIIIAHELKAILHHRSFSNREGVRLLVVRKPRFKTLVFSKSLSLCASGIYL